MTMETIKNSIHRPARKSWIYAILLIVVIGAVAYLGLMNRQDRSTNHDYYRVLYEATNTFDENLNKLRSMHEYKESASSIRSLLPSYSRTTFTDDTDKKSQKDKEEKNLITEKSKLYLGYLLDGKELKFANKDFSASLLIEDILPSPKKGFSQYLFADHEGNVLSTVGDERTISIVDLSSINQEIQRKNKQFQLNLTDTKQQSSSTLPSYSNHVDMKISYGEFRVYVFPFTLTKPIQSPTDKPNQYLSLNQLYLVGLLPQKELAARDSGHWNVSLLVVTIISLLFMWSMLKLYLLPKNQSITKTYRVIANVSSYLFYIVIIALILAYFQKSLLQNSKDQAVVDYAQDLKKDITSDLFDIFTSLNNYRDFYQTLLQTLDTAKHDTLVKDINEVVVKGLSNISVGGCDKVPTNLTDLHKQVGSAATGKKRYPPEDYCKNRIEQDTDFSFELDSEAINILINAYKTNKAGVETLDFFSQLQIVELEPNKSLETYIEKPPSTPLQNKILSVFAINGDGKLVLPSIYYQESHSLPATYNLSHRNYYKQVRDHKGWDLELPEKDKPSFKNVYIQRLLNLNNNTRGTTVSMPLFDPDKDQSKLIGGDHIIGADVLLPSLSLRETPPFDFTYMIIERRSGRILFHNDTERSIVENLYFSGDTGNKISQKLKAGLDQDSDIDNSVFYGMYHGENGRFALSPTVINEWAIVMFYPDDTLQAVMTNQFLFISISFTLTMMFMMLVIYAIRTFIWTSALKEKLRLPAKLNVRFVMLISSVMLSASYSLYLLGTNIDLLYQVNYFSVWLPFTGILIATLLVYRGSTKLFSFPPDVSIKMTQKKSRRGAIWIISAVLIVTCMHFYYIQKTSVAQSKTLANYYQRISCHWHNYERTELTDTGLSRYTNSITINRIDPLLLLPLEQQWYDILREPNATCDNRLAASSLPENFPRMGSLTGSIGVWKWINTYLWRTEANELKDQLINKADKQDLPIAATLLQALLLITIIVLWFKFNIRILWSRLYCPERFMQHITKMTESVRSIETENQNKQLRIECDTVKLNGVGFNLLLRSMSLSTDNKSATPKKVLLEGFTELFEMSPCLQSFSQDKSVLPNLKLHLDSDPTTGLLNAHIWDIETCLEKGVFRQLLLDLIMELKSLTVANQLHSFTIFTGFHSLQRVKMKDPLSQDNSSLLETAEYLSWSECLMDFIVVVPDSFKRGVDWQMLEKEVEAFPELKFLVEPYDKPKQKGNWLEVLKRDEELYHESNWATINYLLLNADALYRFKWESCSSAEKLALINLAKKDRINPMNTQMIEHLALNGLITVRKGHLDIVNRSFAHFVLHAETTATLNQLVDYGEAGTWKNYKLPIGIMILLIIGGIALTSGESIYIIAASMAGVLGTVVSVTNSANMLRGDPKD